LTAIAPALQKLLFKGVLKDEKTIEESKIVPGSRIILMGTTAKDVLQVATPIVAAIDDKPEQPPSLLDETKHQKIIAKGVPDGAEPGIFGDKSPVPDRGIVSLWNNIGVKSRLSFLVGSGEIQVRRPTSVYL
jgi:hypothetical protein